jgi:hypothetical protein
MLDRGEGVSRVTTIRSRFIMSGIFGAISFFHSSLAKRHLLTTP